MAIHRGYVDIAKLLLDNNADVNEAEISEIPLLTAAERGYTDTAELLLEKANANRNGASRIALQAAAEGSHLDIFKLLLDNKAGVSTRSDYSWVTRPYHSTIDSTCVEQDRKDTGTSNV